ncbi:SAM-dependent methyltransferase [hydrothermal vent metagenome]|uniref:SAM-dependent methyltransferase n=1 Tax=hydrothermal vent metagenome TaxID=652676 RepID=A0A1W1BPX6_9ZZZZ
MKQFNSDKHTEILSDDGSYTAYSEEYAEHYHSTKDGALKESLVKHVIPAFSVVDKAEVHILDICYGLGFNTLATLLYYKQNRPQTKLYIYSPELDETLVASLENFTYPDEFKDFKEIIIALSRNGMYEDEFVYIEVFLGDAREYIRKFENKFDIVYQDAFSPSSNPILWTKEYFSDIKKAMTDDGVLTTYSIALKTRIGLYENGFKVYLNEGKDFRGATVASFEELKNFTLVNVEHKMSCNPDVISLRDNQI